MDRAKEVMINELLEKKLIRSDEVDRFRNMNKSELLALRVNSPEIDEIYFHRILKPIFEHHDAPFINCKLECSNGKTLLHFTIFPRFPIGRRVGNYEDCCINLSSKRILEIMAKSYKISLNFVNEDIPMLTADVDTDAHREAKEALRRSGAELCIIEFKDTIGLPNFLKTLPLKLKVWFIAHSEFFRTIPRESWSQVCSFVAKNTLTRPAWQYLLKFGSIEKITATTYQALTERDLLKIAGQWRNNQKIITFWALNTVNGNYNHVEKTKHQRFSNYNNLFHEELLTIAPNNKTGALILSVTRKVMRDESRPGSVEPN